MRMTLQVEPTGATTATVILTQQQVDDLRGGPGRARVPLAITFEGATYRTSVSVYRGQWMMVVNREMREGGLAPGHSYEVDIVMDTAERSVEVPTDLADAISAAGVRDAWDRLSYTHRKEHVRAVEDAKQAETRRRRIAKAVEMLSG